VWNSEAIRQLDAAGAVVTDGVYRVRLEFTEDNSSYSGKPLGPTTPAGFLEFTKGASDVSLNPAGAANYTGVSLAYTAYTPIADAGSDIEVTDNDGHTDTDSLSATVRPAGYEPGLVARWEFEAGDVTTDSSGYGHDGTLRNGAAWVDGGRIGGATYYDGADDLMAVPDSVHINSGTHGKRTVAAWMLANDPSISGRKQIVYEEGGATRGLAIYLHDSRVYLGGWNDEANESNWSGTYLSSTNVIAGKWHHVAMVLNGTAVTQPDAFVAYLDGIQIGSGEGSQLWGHSDDIGIGGLNGSTLLHDGQPTGTHGFAGKIDDVRVYNRALTAADIDTLARNDLDRDNMPDDWERNVSGGTVLRPDDDDDGDGLSNLAEYHADTHPTNGASVLRLTGIDTPGGLRLAWQGGTGAQQRLEYIEGNRPAATGWTPLITLDPPTPAATNALLAPPPSGTRFYRIRAVRP